MSQQRILVLTDLVDSTQLSEHLGDAAMAELWTAHDRLARDLLRSWPGREIDKTDGMLLLFDRPGDALAYTLAYQRGLVEIAQQRKLTAAHEEHHAQRPRLHARAGLHIGPVLLRENSPADVALGAKPLEVDGIAKPTVARVMAICGGGRVLITAALHAALDEEAWHHASEHGKHAVHHTSHGHWSMKGLAEPLEVYEVGHEPHRFATPADAEKGHRVVRVGDRWLPVREIPNNLPPQMTSFIGRERELADIKKHLSGSRLLTLLGMGGLGKTRLSLQAAAEQAHEFPDGVWFLDLAPLRDPALVVSEAARVLSVADEPGTPLLQALCSHLSRQRALFIVDNCEHLLRPAAELVAALLRAAPQLRIIASSREALHVAGEQSYPVLPLAVPSAGAPAAEVAQSTAVRLFVDRARQHKPAFAVIEREAPALAELVTRLDGIPLAIELAAARVRTLGVGEINARLKDRYKLLASGGRLVLPRQQTLRALVDWSYDLLSGDEQTLLARLSVFAGGFDLEAAEQVTGAEPLAGDDVLDLLGSLVEKSLVMAEERDTGMRYRMLETVRVYALEKLGLAPVPDDGSAASALLAMQGRHCLHFFLLAKAARDGLNGPEQAEWIDRIDGDLDNLRAAVSCALAGGVDPFIAVKLAVALLGFWLLRGHGTEGRSVVRAALAMPQIQASDMAQAHALYVGAALASVQSDHAEARQMLEACLVLRRRLGNPVDVAATLSTLSLARLQSGDAPAAREGELEALQLFHDQNDRRGEAIVMLHLGQIAVHLGEFDAAVERLQAGLAIAREIHHPEIEGDVELVLGIVAYERGQRDEAVRHCARSLTVCRDAGAKRGEAIALWWLGKTDLQDGELASARRRLTQALQAFRGFEMRDELLGCLEDHAALAGALLELERAGQLAGAASEWRDRLKLARPPYAEQRWQAQLAGWRSTDALTFDRAWAVGRQLEMTAAMQAALLDAAAEGSAQPAATAAAVAAVAT